MKTDKRTRDEKLEDSIMGDGSEYEFYAIGRTRRLRRLGNPFFGGDGKQEDWDMERKLGTAWVFFTRGFEEIDKLMALKNPLTEIDKIWEQGMHASEQERIYDWILEQAGLTAAAQTEAIKERGGKSQQEQEGTNHTG